MMPGTGADQWIIRIKTDTIERSANDPNTWTVLVVIMVVAAAPAHSLQTQDHKNDTVEYRLDSMDDSKINHSILTAINFAFVTLQRKHIYQTFARKCIEYILIHKLTKIQWIQVQKQSST